MAILTTRVIFSDNGTLSDYGIELQNYREGSQVFDVVAAEDALYIGADHPFNHRYFQLNTVNTAPSDVSVELWDGSAWNPVAEITDETSASGASLGQDGVITWVPDRDESWVLEDTTEDISDLFGVEIYNKYWCRFKWSADLDVGTDLFFVGQRFSSDEDLETLYPSLNTSDQKEAFQTGKTTWNEQHIEAAKLIMDDLIDKGTTWHEGQIIDIERFRVAAVHRVAMIAFREYGDDYRDNLIIAANDYREAFERAVYNVDKNRNARLDRNEQLRDLSVRRR